MPPAALFNRRLHPYHGLTRSYYYEAEKAGQLKLIRLRKKGNVRGVTLVPYQAVAELIRKAAAESQQPIPPANQTDSEEFPRKNNQTNNTENHHE